MIPSARGPLVMEVNSSPGLEGIEKATGINIAGKIMDYIEANVEKDNPKKRVRKDSIGA
jgi:ribosomal protein S6--L-glutamate ligase